MTPQHKIAIRFCEDLWKKFNQLERMPADERERVLAGISDALQGATQPHPTTDLCLPPIRPAFDAPYEAGYDVGYTWARIARDWGKTAPTMDDPAFS